MLRIISNLCKGKEKGVTECLIVFAMTELYLKADVVLDP